MNYFFILLLVIGFFLYWNFLLMIISILGGWNRLSKEHNGEGINELTDEVFHFQSLKLGYFVSYSSSLTVTFYESGFSMKPFFLFSFFHNPVFIKYEELDNFEMKSFLGFKYAICCLNGKRLTFSGKFVSVLYDKIKLKK